MSLVTVSLGKARSSFQVQLFGSSISPATENVHSSSDTRGVGPADRTGKSETTCCPGGTPALETLPRRLPRNPRQRNPIRPPCLATHPRYHASLPPPPPPHP